MDKLSPRGLRCQLVGFNGTSIYRMWGPVSSKIDVTSDVRFLLFEASSPTPQKLSELSHDSPGKNVSLVAAKVPTLTYKKLSRRPDFNMWLEWMEREISDLERL